MALDFALRCSAAGHAVRWYRYSKKGKVRDGEGFKGFEIVDDWRPHMKWARDGLILNTGNYRFITELDRYRDLGFKVFAPTEAAAALEIDRGVGMDAMKEAGIDLPPYRIFNGLEEAEKAARKSDLPLVFKPMGDEEDKSLTYVSSDPADLVGWIRQKIAQGTKLKGQVMLQEKVDALCELGVSGWFGPDGFLPGKWQICVEHKKLLDGEVGPQTGEMGTVTQYCESDKLANELLTPMVGTLRRLGHRGDFAVGAMIDKAGKAWPLEFTARCGYPAWFIQAASHKGDPAQWMRDLLDGKDTLKVSSDVAIGVVCAIPRWPYGASPPEVVEGKPISGIADILDDLHFASVMMGKGPRMEGGEIVERPCYMTTGEYVMVATALGKTIERARRKVYATVGKVKIPDLMFRADIGLKLEAPLPKLHGFGYATEMAFS